MKRRHRQCKHRAALRLARALTMCSATRCTVHCRADGEMLAVVRYDVPDADDRHPPWVPGASGPRHDVTRSEDGRRASVLSKRGESGAVAGSWRAVSERDWLVCDTESPHLPGSKLFSPSCRADLRTVGSEAHGTWAPTIAKPGNPHLDSRITIGPTHHHRSLPHSLSTLRWFRCS